ncbi:DUF4199 domain-containing protein [Fibrivirga algicola]|uniref:DUF4199 domain-containing protein n=1 Tax=Fibrivirga algicola TaxID=2950420 RepID=A0ABX0QPA3_9BACT|nr:DUF4199 domain-containing protein [Fibrivirga algicola]ARK11221.1 hypothetical protein A6C57_13330 [Fibrella sp. ES10-3-2-2]NID13086.1 DUF4199 domain-containing protein [Fibrivirga algicola]
MHEKPSTARLALKWGLITGVALIIYSTLLFTLGQTANSGLTMLIYLIMAGGLFMGIREYRILNGGYLSIGEGMGTGTLQSAVSGIISATYSLLYTTFIDPSVTEQIQNQMRAQMEDQGKLTDEQIDQAMEVMQKFQSPGLQFMAGVLGAIFIGAILSLLISAIMRRKNNNPFG